MGLLQRAIETYDANTALIGVYRDGHEPLAPIGHILTSANIEITLNAQGKFLAARKVDKKEPKILIPVTEESSGRTSGLAAHPLCDQLKYVANTNKEAHELYLTALRKWERSAYAHPFLTAISTYVRNGSVLKDLTKCGVLALEKGGGYDEEPESLLSVRILLLQPAGNAGYGFVYAGRKNRTHSFAASQGHHPGEWECKADLGQ